ncbi:MULTISPECIES: MarR family winged helix-turn-helix transcriptional regulator [Rhizobium]|nr:MarR family transcriptional regulator [Rhizobium sp. AP16]EJK88014.1 transcriptional regulator [Rhizobium sp. AP16]OCJ19136.1 transcriptional regulator [Agrobacterium sp. B131/95]
MSDELDDYEDCTRAFNAFMGASAAILARVTQALDEHFSLSINEYNALACLDAGGQESRPLMAICEAVRLSQPAISRLADRLEHRGLIERQSGLEDRRNVCIQLTTDGRALLHRAMPVHAAAAHETLFKRLTLHEREVFRKILMKLDATNDDDGKS